MSNHSANHQIKQQANVWISCLKRGLTEDEKPRLVAWINQNPIHHQAIYKYASFFDNLSELNELNGIFPLEKKSPILLFNKVKILSPILFVLIFTLLAVFIKLPFFEQKSSDQRVKTYLTQIGEISTVELDDGSKITLNTHTKLRVDYGDTYRKVNLLFGEAQFDVAKDSERPFTVSAGAKSFTALGTIFNVQKDNESDMELIVSEGQVLVSEAHHDLHKLADIIRTETAKFDSSVIISAGKKTKIENAKQSPTISLTADQSNKELAWQYGMLVFNGEPLVQALSEVTRYTNIQFEISHEDISNIKISGYFKAGDVNGLLVSLANNFDLDYKFNATNTVQISRSINH